MNDASRSEARRDFGRCPVACRLMTVARRSASMLGCALMIALATAGCESGHRATTPASRSPRNAPSSLPESADGETQDPHAPSVAKAPHIASDGITSLVSGAAVKGNAVYAIPGGIKKGKTLAIAINCKGSGQLAVQVQPTATSFPLLCEKGKVLPTMNEIHMSNAHSSASLRFTSGPNVVWSFAAGWDSNPPEQR
ncbi:hypothetical protein [Streptomyces sp. AM6-12]|uniref:hypothetical protein n=1 Tax=Streptomyces sp. AM6-12 TaxID=3345149 RepID=UPI0037A373BF